MKDMTKERLEEIRDFAMKADLVGSEAVLELLDKIENLDKKAEFYKSQFNAKALRNGQNCIERDKLKEQLQSNKLTETEQKRIARIKDRREKFAYGLAQADYDIGFLLRIIEGLGK